MKSNFLGQFYICQQGRHVPIGKNVFKDKNKRFKRAGRDGAF